MSKRELIDRICEINKTARAEFLATFSEEELQNYFEHLRQLSLEEPTICAADDSHRHLELAAQSHFI
jgi:hypothetical protein